MVRLPDNKVNNKGIAHRLIEEGHWLPNSDEVFGAQKNPADIKLRKDDKVEALKKKFKNTYGW